MAQAETPSGPARGPVRWTLVIPYYNEERWLPATLESLSNQTLRPFRLVLVNNGSTDGGPELARQWAARQQGIEVSLIDEPTPGQVHALAAGIAAAASEWLAICDADTFYPPHYLEAATANMEAAGPDVVGFIAHDVRGNPDAPRWRLKRFVYTHVIPRILRRQAHGGGYAHLMRTAPFKESGGYSAALWPYVLKDHELVNRLTRFGRIAYASDLWVTPSDRRADRKGVRWTLFERILYHLTPPATKDWFFYRFLGPRFAARGQKDTVLRAQPWEGGSSKEQANDTAHSGTRA
ncbi:glycosyltransferase family 2 protein [Sandaracinobacteroides sp. A072]|uniref:glycosyltransferase family 2 protein n=1 Tax=Sandaracinobacteroides sp. A072 TaxID=3461146 RepID=UPI004042A49C